MSNTILISYKAYYLKVHGNDTTYDGEYWGGVYSTDNGATWTITGPLSDSTIDGFIEVAYRLVNINGDIYAYGLWAGAGVLGFNFVRGAVKPFYTTGIAENSNNSLKDIQFTLSPTVVTNLAHVSFHVPKSGNATLTLFDVTGRFVESVFNGVLDKGTNTININTSKLANGIYFVSFETKAGTQTAKFIIAR
ncbi:MAG: T9SS type A sorting domain-containing protein, partial [Thermoplasmatales archaeon]|nr:T9SS type A sorting domain-containing protein [Thermoplasmatales archaeon]